MAKLLAAVTLASVLLVIVATASAYRTIITTVHVDEASFVGPDQCRAQIQKVDLSSCKQYMSKSRPQLALQGIQNPQQQEQGPPQQCCKQIRQVDQECQCDALGSLIEEQRKQHPGQEHEQLKTIARRATGIHIECGLPECRSPQIHRCRSVRS